MKDYRLATPVYQNDAEAGLKLLWLMVNSRTWVHRRVDSLRLDADGGTRRYVSVDMTPPDFAALGASEKCIHVPLAILAKGPKKRLSVSTGSTAVPVLARQMNTDLVVGMLVAGLEHFVRVTTDELAVGRHLLPKVVGADSTSARTQLASYLEWTNEVRERRTRDDEIHEKFAALNSLVRQFADNYLLVGVLDKELLSTRTIVKYALHQPLPELKAAGMKQVRFKYEVPDYGFAASQHVEVELPPGLTIKALELAEFGAGSVTTQVAKDPTAANDATPSKPVGRLGHVVLNPLDRSYSGIVRVDVLPASPGLFTFVRAAVVAVVAVICISLAFRMWSENMLLGGPPIPSPSASILLIGPALLFSWISRKHEHELVVEIASPLRRVLYLCAGVLVIMAGLAAIPVRPLAWDVAWIAAYLVTAAAVGIFFWYAKGWGIRDKCRQLWLRWFKPKEGQHGAPPTNSLRAD